jgi:hypothetical protein
VPSTSLLPLPLSLDDGIRGNGHDTSSLNSISLELTDHGGVEAGVGADVGVSPENVSDRTVVIMGAADAVDSDSEDEVEGDGVGSVPVPLPIAINGVHGNDSSNSNNDISSDHAALENFNAACPPTIVITQTTLPAPATSLSASASIISSSHTSAAVPVEDEVTVSFAEGGDDMQTLPCGYSDPGSATGAGNSNETAAQGFSRKRSRAAKDK